MDNVNRCYYCNVQPAEEGSTTSFEYEMFYVSKRTIFPAGINYHSKKVMIPRCAKCKQIHKLNYLFLVLTWVTVALGSYFLFKHATDVNLLTNCILSVLISSLFCWLANVIYNDFLFKPIFKIKPESAVDDYAIVTEMLDEGWTGSRPDPAGSTTAAENKETRKWGHLKSVKEKDETSHL